jgi:hypothetical protein
MIMPMDEGNYAHKPLPTHSVAEYRKGSMVPALASEKEARRDRYFRSDRDRFDTCAKVLQNARNFAKCDLYEKSIPVHEF